MQNNSETASKTSSRVYYQDALPKCLPRILTKLSYQDIFARSLPKVLTKTVFPRFLPRPSSQDVFPRFLPRPSSQDFYQDCLPKIITKTVFPRLLPRLSSQDYYKFSKLPSAVWLGLRKYSLCVIEGLVFGHLEELVCHWQSDPEVNMKGDSVFCSFSVCFCSSWSDSLRYLLRS